MSASVERIPVAIESGKKRTFAVATDWPGWARSGRDEASALEALAAYGPRYAEAIRRTGLEFIVPDDSAAFEVTERVTGNATTDFGAPDIVLLSDDAPLNAGDLERSLVLLDTCWKVFGEMVKRAEGKTLRTDPRGGGRSLEKIVDHVFEGHFGYLSRINWRKRPEKTADTGEMIAVVRQDDAQALALAVSGDMPETGPRGGKLWKPRFFIRRAAWHLLDHAWEIEDRIIPGS